MWIFMVLFVFQEIYCFDDFEIDPRLSLQDSCVKLCLEHKLPALEPGNFENFLCQSGCRFFNAQQYGGGLDMNPAIKHCHISCKETYGYPEESDVCITGCELIAATTQNSVQKMLIMTQQERANSNNNNNNELVLGEPDSDLLESDVLSDPSIKSQLEVGFNVDYKIPETHIRTMPIEDKDQPTKIIRFKGKDSGDWLDCASKNSGIPRWILLTTMLGAILVAIWLTLSMESRKGHEDCDDEMLAEIPGENEMENYVIEKDVMLLDNDSFNVGMQFIPPPKYSEINELDNSEPPNYFEAVENQKTEEKA